MNISTTKLTGIGVGTAAAMGLVMNGSMNWRQNLDDLDAHGHKHNNSAYSLAKGMFPDNWHDVWGIIDRNQDNANNGAGLPEIGSDRTILAGKVIVNFAYQG